MDHGQWDGGKGSAYRKVDRKAYDSSPFWEQVERQKLEEKETEDEQDTGNRGYSCPSK